MSNRKTQSKNSSSRSHRASSSQGRSTSSHGSSRRGFAAMDPEQHRQISAMGGRASHGGHGRDYVSSQSGNYGSRNEDYYDEDRGGSRGGSRRGFAAMDPQEQRRISAMGGRASHDGGRRSHNSDYDDYDSYEEDNRGGSRGGSRRGFAAMDPEEQRQIASMGGRASHGGGRGYNSDYDEEDDSYQDENQGRRGGRGFSGMDSEEHRQISSMGGRASRGGNRQGGRSHHNYR